MSELERALAKIAGAGRLLVASDFDGTLAPIADLPDAVEADPLACGALQRMARLDGTPVAVISGRAKAVLRDLLGDHAAGLRLVGSHGAELEDHPVHPVLDAEAAEARDGLRSDFEAIAPRYPGALVEPKPFVAEADQERAAEEAREAVRARGLRVQEGHKVVEAVAVEADKGAALDAVRRACEADATFFIGDDVTDEHAFDRLGPGDLGIKVGPGETAAHLRVEDQSAVATVLARLSELRERHLAREPAAGAEA